MSQKEIKNQLIDLYLFLKIRKSDEIEKITKEDIENEKENLNILPTKDIINYIKNSIETLIELKACEKYEEKVLNEESKKLYRNDEDKNDENGLLLYEGMLIKAEKDIRKHIRVIKYIYIIYYILFKIQIEQELKLRLEEVENELNEIRDKKGILNKYYHISNDKHFFEPIENKKIINNINKEEKKEETKSGINNKKNKDEAAPNTANNSKKKSKNDKNNIDKNNAIIIKKLENENSYLRKLLITYKLRRNKEDISTGKMKKFNNCFEKKMWTLSANKNNINNNTNFSNIYHNTDNSLINNSNNISNAKNSLSNNLLENIIDKISLIPKKCKNSKKNSESCSILLTDGNVGQNFKKNKYKEIIDQSKKSKNLINEIKLNKTNIKFKKHNKSKMNSIYLNRNNILNNVKDLFDINRNNDINNLGNTFFNTNFDKKKNRINNISEKLDFKRDKNLAIKSSQHSLKMEKTNPILINSKKENNLNSNNSNSIFPYGKVKIQKNMKSFNLLNNIINHNSINDTTIKINNLFDIKRNSKINKKKFNNYHSISSVTDKKLNDSKFNSSISFDIKKKYNENEKKDNKSINNNIFDKYIKKSEKKNNNKKSKESNDNMNKNKLKYYMTYSTKVKKIINENMNKMKNINKNLRNDNKLVNSSQKKNNIFFTINKTIIHNMNNTFSNSNNNNCITNINNSEEEINNEAPFSPSLTKKTIDNTDLYNGFNLKKKIIERCQMNNNYNLNNKLFVSKTNANDKITKKIQNNKRKIFINKHIL